MKTVYVLFSTCHARKITAMHWAVVRNAIKITQIVFLYIFFMEEEVDGNEFTSGECDCSVSKFGNFPFFFLMMGIVSGLQIIMLMWRL